MEYWIIGAAALIACAVALGLTLAKNRREKGFLQKLDGMGVRLSGMGDARALARADAAAVSGGVLLEEKFAVRKLCAPREPLAAARATKSPQALMLMAAVALGSEDEAQEAFCERLGFEPGRMLRQFPMRYCADEGGTRLAVHADASGLRAYAKGEADDLLARCDRVHEGRERTLDDQSRDALRQTAREMEAEGLTVVAYATKALAEDENPSEGMTFLGMLGLGDAAKPEAARGMDALAQAGIRPILMTDAAPPDALLLACGARGETLTGAQIDAMDDEALQNAMSSAGACLRLNAAQTARAIHASGDGVIALGIPGGALSLADVDLETLARSAIACRAFCAGRGG